MCCGCRVAVTSVVAGGLLLAYTVQARDLFADLGLRWWQWLIFFALAFAWSWIVHASARRSLQHDDWVPQSHTGGLSEPPRSALQGLYWYPALWIPRLLGLGVFFFIGFAIFRVYLNLKTARDGLPEAEQAVTLAWILLAATIAATVLYVWLIWKQRTFEDWVVVPGQWRHNPPLLAGTAPLFASYIWPKHTRPTPSVPRELVDKALSVTRFVVVVLLLITLFDPHLFASRGPRLFFVPVLLGGAVVLLGEVAAWSLRWRTPLLLVVVVIGFTAVYLTESFHDTRWIETTVQPSKGAGSAKQITMADAIARWRQANNCATDSAACPRPILIAGAGGASRAGFFTATVVGALIDLGLDDQRGAPYGDIRSRIFAMSTVSGSSAGAAVMRAAFLDAAERNAPKQPPCRIAGAGSWFGLPLMEQDRNFDPKKYWRDCFQAILAGDFLSPVFVALAYRDNFPFINPFTQRPAWPDRAVLLEQAFERRYSRFTAEAEASCPDERPKSAGNAGTEGMCRPFGYHPTPQAAGAWVPLFFINGASVFTGRRIVVGDVAATDASSGDFLPLAYDLNELRDWPKQDPQKRPTVQKGEDIRLSTSATMSARFPVISPQGLLRNLHGDINDQIVDGGYFENDGLATIADVVPALRSKDLDPVVIRIVNEPTNPKAAKREKNRPAAPAPEDRTPFDDVFAIARALISSRSGHEDHHQAVLESRLKNPDRLYEIGVYVLHPPGAANVPQQQQSMSPQDNPVCRRGVKAAANMERVSMSWWMSQPVQAYLDAQLCVRANWERLECELSKGRAATRGECPRKPD